MSERELTYKIPALEGDDEGQAPLILSNTLSPNGSYHLYIDKLGRITPVGGISAVNVSAHTTSGGQTGRTRGMFFFKKIAAGATTRQLLFIVDDGTDEYEINYSTDFGATKTLIVDLGAGSVGSLPDWTVFGDILIFTNGVVIPKTWTGSAWADAGGTQLGAITAASGAAGVLRGTYRWILVPMIGKTPKIGSVASTAIALNDVIASLTWTADADGTVTGYELYRTSGTGLDYYFVAYIDGRTTAAYSDNMPDTQLIRNAAMSLVRSHGQAPPTGVYFNDAHGGRMWYAKTDTFPRRAWWTEPGDYDSVYQDRHYTEFTEAESIGDQLTGITGEFEGLNVFWMRDSVWTISGTGRLQSGVFDWRKNRTKARTGTVSARTVGKVPAGSVYTDARGEKQLTTRSTLVYLTPEKDIRLFDGDNDVIISNPKQESLRFMNLEQAHKACVEHDEVRGLFRWFFPRTDDFAITTENGSDAVVWDYVHGAWFSHRVNWPGIAAVAESTTETNVILHGSARGSSVEHGFIQRQWSGLANFASSMFGHFVTNAIYPPIVEDGPPDLVHLKRLLAVTFLFVRNDDDPTMSLQIYNPDDAIDMENPVEFPKVIQPFTADGRVRIPARAGTSLVVFVAGTDPGRYFHGYGFRLAFIQTLNAGGDAAFKLQGIEILYQVLEGTQL